MSQVIEKKTVFYVTEAFPHNNHGGGALTSLNISKILNKNFYVYLILLDNGYEKNFRYIDKKLFKKVIILKDIKKTKKIYSTHNYLFGSQFIKKINILKLKYKPYLIYSYGFSSSEAISQLNDVLKIGSVGDPLYLPRAYKKNEILKDINLKNFIFSAKFLLRYLIIDLIVIWKLKSKILKIISNFETFGCFSNHHAKNDLFCEYFKTPLEQTRPVYNLKLTKNYIKLLHVGHLKGTITMNSFKNLVNKVCPKLIKIIGKKNLEISVVGKFHENIPMKLKKKIKKFGVFKFHGYLNNNRFDSELKKADALIACNDINLGSRIRILTALSKKTLVITHKANLDGTPELRNNFNCLVGKNFDELIQLCTSLKKDLKKKKKIKLNGFKTVKKNFSFYAFEKLLLQKISNFYKRQLNS